MKATMQFFQKNGYAIIPKFISGAQCDGAIKEIDRLIDQFNPTPEEVTIFGGDSSQTHQGQKYFLESADKVRFFYEKQAWKDKKLMVPKRESINKIGHSLHQKNPIFQDITYTHEAHELCREMKIEKPLVVQSMAILKPPKIGGQVTIHQDSTYLYAQPETLLGFWIPLQNATLENGCLWGLPGSHHSKLYSRLKYPGGDFSKGPVVEKYHEIDYQEKDFVPIEMERGSLIVFTGRFLHKSHANTSNHSRYAYTWHLMDESSKWSPQNWLQRTEFPKFPLKPKS